mgnify:CR=1 FL=1
MKSLTIYNPIFLEPTYARISISKWNFDKLADKDGNLLVVVKNGDKIAGQGMVNKQKWIKTAKLKEKKVVFRPQEPMEYYHNNLPFEQPKTEEDTAKENYLISQGLI